MSLSTRRSRNLFVQLITTLTFCLFQAGLLAQEQAERILFAVTDDGGNRLEVVIPEDGDAMVIYVRFYENITKTKRCHTMIIQKGY